MTSETPNVSLIVPVYNGEAYLRECLDSVLIPAPECSVEIICVNDGSTDGSPALLKQYAAQYPCITVINQPNGGLSAARNAGMRAAHGEYIQFLDCDDRLAPGTLDKLYEQASRQQLDILYFDGETFYEEAQYQKSHSHYDTLYQTKIPLPDVLPGQELFVALCQGRSYRSSACLQMIRRAFLEELALTFLEGVYYEDNLFTLYSLLHARRTAVCAVSLYQRRMHSGSIVTSHKSYKHVRSYLICFLEMAAFTERGHYSREVTECVKMQLSSLLSHARQSYAQLTDREKQQALEHDPDNTWLQLLLDGSGSAGDTPFSWVAILKEIYGHLLQNRWFRALFKPFRALLHAVRRLRHGEPKDVYQPSAAYAELCAAAYDPEHPFVSVVMPVYNTEAYLPAALDDLRKQTLKNFEVLLVDDGSTDRSVAIIQSYMRKDPRFKLLRQENAFAGVARNNGLEHAKGDYLLFLDSDDRFDKQLLALSYDKARQTNAQVVMFDADVLQMPEEIIFEAEMLSITRWLPTEVFAGKDEPRHLFDMLNPWTKLFQRSYIMEQGFRFQPLFCTNDAHFTMVSLACAERIAALPCRLVHYRIGGGGNIQSLKDRSPLDVYTAFAATKDCLQARGLYETFARPLAARAVESMLRQLDTLKSRQSQEQLFDLLHREGLTYLDLDLLTVADMPAERGADILRRCHAIRELSFEAYLAEETQHS